MYKKNTNARLCVFVCIHTHYTVLLDFVVKPEHFLTGFVRFPLTSEMDRQGKRQAVNVFLHLI